MSRWRNQAQKRWPETAKGVGEGALYVPLLFARAAIVDM